MSVWVMCMSAWVMGAWLNVCPHCSDALAVPNKFVFWQCSVDSFGGLKGRLVMHKPTVCIFVYNFGCLLLPPESAGQGGGTKIVWGQEF